MTVSEDLEALRLFNEKAAKLTRRTFVEQIRQGGLGAVVEWKRGSGWDSVHVGPDEEGVDAAVLTVRFFVQNNERVSLYNMAQIYGRLPFGREHADRCLALRQGFNDFLDEPTNIAIREGGNLTHREVMDLFLYGWLSHANPDKARAILDLSETPFFPVLQTDFARVILALIRTVAAMSEEHSRILAVADSTTG